MLRHKRSLRPVEGEFCRLNVKSRLLKGEEGVSKLESVPEARHYYETLDFSRGTGEGQYGR